MTTELQKAYLRGYAKGRAFQKKEKLSDATSLMPRPGIATWTEVNSASFSSAKQLHDSFRPFYHKALAFFRNGLSLH